MTKFKLEIGKELQGKFEIKNVNVAFTFQVNCPGCFAYGIPLMNSLYDIYMDKVGFIGISTAFEDFNYNTSENTSLLLQEGKTVGETAKYLAHAGLNSYPDIPKFPIAFDALTSIDQIDLDELTDEYFTSISEDKSLKQPGKAQIKSHLEQYYISLQVIAKTFTLNQMKGTPSFIIFDDAYDILNHSFGHGNEQQIRGILSNRLST